MSFIRRCWSNILIEKLPLFLLACIFLANAASFRLNRKTAVIPVKIIHNIALIPVEMNRVGNLTFLLDSGLRRTILIEPMLVPLLHLDSLKPITLSGIGSEENIQAFQTKHVDISTADLQIKGLDLLVANDEGLEYSSMFGVAVHGLLGREIFEHYVVEFFYARKQVRLHDPRSFRPDRRSVALPLKMINGQPFIEAQITTSVGQSIDGYWLLDTGGSMPLFVLDQSLQRPAKTIETCIGKGLRGRILGTMGRYQSVSIGKFTLNNVIASFPDSLSIPGWRPSHVKERGMIGGALLSRFRVALDIPNQVVYLRKAIGYSKPFTYNISGAEFEYSESRKCFSVSYIRTGSAAENAGLALNDTLVSINYVPADSVDMELIYEWLAGKMGCTVPIEIRRGTSTLNLKLILKSEI